MRRDEETLPSRSRLTLALGVCASHALLYVRRLAVADKDERAAAAPTIRVYELPQIAARLPVYINVNESKGMGPGARTVHAQRCTMVLKSASSAAALDAVRPDVCALS